MDNTENSPMPVVLVIDCSLKGSLKEQFAD